MISNIIYQDIGYNMYYVIYNVAYMIYNTRYIIIDYRFFIIYNVQNIMLKI